MSEHWTSNQFSCRFALLNYISAYGLNLAYLDSTQVGGSNSEFSDLKVETCYDFCMR